MPGVVIVPSPESRDHEYGHAPAQNVHSEIEKLNQRVEEQARGPVGARLTRPGVGRSRHWRPTYSWAIQHDSRTARLWLVMGMIPHPAQRINSARNVVTSKFEWPQVPAINSETYTQREPDAGRKQFYSPRGTPGRLLQNVTGMPDLTWNEW
jgi:hypothetical protein